MDVILLERIRKLGQMGDVVTVKDGFARNFLLPYGKALHATPANRERFERDKVEIEARNLEMKSEADKISDKLDGKEFVVIRQASDAGQLFGSVATRDVVEHVKEAGYSIERRQVLLDKPIKTLGIYSITIALHGDVDCSISVNVARSEEEAVRQARGEDILTEEQDEDDLAVDIEEVFEDEEKAREAAEQLSDEEAEEDASAPAPKAAPQKAAENSEAGESETEAAEDEAAKDD